MAAPVKLMRSAPQVAAPSTVISTPPLGTSITLVTPALASNFTDVEVLAMAKMFQVYQVTVSGPCRVRLYATAAAQAADAARSSSVLPIAGTQHGVILDLYLDTADKWNWTCSPVAPGANNDSPQSISVYATFTNLSTSTAAIGITISYVPQES